MEIQQFFNKDLIFIDQEIKNTTEAISFISLKLKSNNFIADFTQTQSEFSSREEQVSTYLGDFIAMPHIRNKNVVKNSIMFIKNSKAISWNNTPGQEEVKFIFAIALNDQEQADLHIQIIQQLSKMFMQKEFLQKLEAIKTQEEFLQLISRFSSENEEKTQETFTSKFDVVAITSCPTGIAHTYLAKSNLEEAAKKMGVSIKVETQGADGVQNKLTNFELKNAKGLIIASDREIEKSRFAHLDNVLEVSAKKAIHNAEEQIKKVLEHKGKMLKTASASSGNASENEAQISFYDFHKRMYRSLLSGISYMLPFIVFGGIIIAFAFILDLIIGAAYGQNLNSPAFLKSFGSNYAFSNLILSVGKIGMSLAVSILAAFISFSLIGRQGLLPGFVIGAIASGQLASSYGFLAPSLANDYNLSANQILTTGSGFIGAIFGGFFAAAMVIVFNNYILKALPKNLQGIKNILLIPLLATITIALLFWALNIVLIYVNFGLTIFLSILESKTYLVWLLGLVIGAMMAFDLGGPVNKAAYIFATFTVSQRGTSSISMAAAMLSGMIPPLGISLSMFVNKKLWTKEQIHAGKYSNIVFGLSFISEGAIPYTANKPKVLFPSNIIAGIVTGISSALLGINIIAPHGGIFVVFLARTNLVESTGAQIGLGILFWILVLLIGTITHAFCIWFFSKVEKLGWNFKKIFKKEAK
ncbi:PTS fructose transporter subunit IIABC [Mesomycoplasma hyorhinis]|uniref:PTS fructose transporter subunit IIABC n=1 Tax=Mesomycoplasma hyorhinis TaxID=2100 RepID=UPI001C05A104|nr:fructose-specific PTS transporter subunit EIIC [Mesomycoplasma hyorhinis]UVT34065.1 fructose-specific PTS transporter subunit EIIC [Mesomycoplasma hyorhinis]